jgi:hypothetical protein
MRVPSDLVPRIGKKFVRVSLKTRDPKEAIQRAEPLAKKYLSQFQALQADEALLPAHAAQTAKQIAQGYGEVDHFLNLVVEPKLAKYAGSDEARYNAAEPKDFLTPLEQQVLDVFNEGKGAATALGCHQTLLEDPPEGRRSQVRHRRGARLE